jgi:hypothetical protein
MQLVVFFAALRLCVSLPFGSSARWILKVSRKDAKAQSKSCRWSLLRGSAPLRESAFRKLGTLDFEDVTRRRKDAK